MLRDQHGDDSRVRIDRYTLLMAKLLFIIGFISGINYDNTLAVYIVP